MAEETNITKPFDEALRAEVEKAIETRNMLLEQVANEFGIGFTRISKWLNKHPDGNVQRLEARARDWLRRVGLENNIGTPLFAWANSRKISDVFDDCVGKHYVRAIWGPAGAGKTCAIALYCKVNETAIDVTAYEWDCNAHDVEALIFNRISDGTWKGNTKRAHYIIEKLKGTSRIIIIDNAHKLTRRAIGWLFSLHDATGVPIAFVGNPEMEGVLRTNDQWWSRMAAPLRVTVNTKDSAELANKIAQAITPAAGDEITEAIGIRGSNKGHFRAVKYELVTARKIVEEQPHVGWAAALSAAHTCMVH